MITVSPSVDSRNHREPARELKFLVSPTVAAAVHHWASAHLSLDPFADPSRGDSYHITSLYFDTPGWHVFRRIGSFARSKYRVRRYDGHEGVFLERKLKAGGRVSKRRTVASTEELNRLSGADPDRSWRGSWYHRRLLARGLQPVCQISYRRAAWLSASSQGTLRLTLDDRLRTKAIAEPAFDDSRPGLELLPEQFVLELKFRNDLPDLFTGMVQEFALQPQPLSKYRLAASALGLADNTSLNDDRAGAQVAGGYAPAMRPCSSANHVPSQFFPALCSNG